MMYPQTKAEQRLQEFREWSRQHRFVRCRLVHYCGPEVAGAVDVPLDEIEGNIRGFVEEGFGADWALKDMDCLVLVCWESWKLPLEWDCIFGERDFEQDWDVDDIIGG